MSNGWLEGVPSVAGLYWLEIVGHDGWSRRALYRVDWEGPPDMPAMPYATCRTLEEAYLKQRDYEARGTLTWTRIDEPGHSSSSTPPAKVKAYFRFDSHSLPPR